MTSASPGLAPAPLTEVSRGGVIESVHYGAVAVVDADGHVLRAAGDPYTRTFTRSALKPLAIAPDEALKRVISLGIIRKEDDIAVK